MAKRIAVVTGGMGGLGESISTKMHDAGYRVVATYSPGNSRAADWQKQMKTKGYEFATYSVDVADFDSCRQTMEKVKAEVGPVDTTSRRTPRSTRAVTRRRAVPPGRPG